MMFGPFQRLRSVSVDCDCAIGNHIDSIATALLKEQCEKEGASTKSERSGEMVGGTGLNSMEARGR